MDRYFNPLIYLNDQNLYTLQLGLQQYSSQYGREWGLLMAAAVLISLPPIIIFFLTQRTFVQGVTLTGIKAVSEALMPDTIRVAAVQMSCQLGDKAANMAEAEASARGSGRAG